MKALKSNTIVLFASGSGTNAENLISYFKKTKTAKVTHVFCNNPNAKVIFRAKKLNVPVTVFDKNDFLVKKTVQNKLKELSPDWIVLAGFLWKITPEIVSQFPNKIINIHPALLPNYGGKGMYGMHIHEAVVKNKESTTGITIHYVNEAYDEGAIIFQEEVALSENDTPQDVARKIHELEQTHFPKVIESLLDNE
ncbi:MAG: phosphoribosylglycinamide formyltransferase [Flavobacteriaceae bacterium]|nr:phosphoribosylglycinamide formyltransferase [Flavobacteriaceae bacterium]MDG2314755.1 phosphoribosylglycinamide formyltransferase [Flavobacteriaceae bacterium]